MARPRAKKIKAPFANEAAQFQAAMLGARMSIREVAARFWAHGSEDRRNDVGQC
jgi:hypothetical protein